jgi:hypothetical protein
VRPGGLGIPKKLIHLIGSLTCDFPTCSILIVFSDLSVLSKVHSLFGLVRWQTAGFQTCVYMACRNDVVIV